MNKPLLCLFVFLVLCSTAFGQRKYVGWSMGYWTTWGGQSAANVNYKCYTHLAYFDGSINMPSTSSGQSFTTACHNNNTVAVKTLGGAGAGGSFTSSTTSGNLANYVNTVVAAMQAQKFDGLDIDWEDGVNSAQFQALCQAIAAAFAKITPKPLLTYATGMGLAQYAAPVYAIADQLNLMSYYDKLTGGGAPIPTQLAAFTSKGVPKSKLGLGYGYGSDNEVDAPNIAGNGPNGNPSDIDAKCQYTVDNGYGGIMIWAVGSAPKVCDSVTAYYVNKNPVPVLAFAPEQRTQQSLFTVVNGASDGIARIRYTIPSTENIDMKLFTMNGALVQTLYHGSHEGGTFSIPIQRGSLGTSVGPGMYVLKFSTPTDNRAGTVVVK
jgi:hypothetical protein